MATSSGMVVCATNWSSVKPSMSLLFNWDYSEIIGLPQKLDGCADKLDYRNLTPKKREFRKSYILNSFLSIRRSSLRIEITSLSSSLQVILNLVYVSVVEITDVEITFVGITIDKISVVDITIVEISVVGLPL